MKDKDMTNRFDAARLQPLLIVIALVATVIAALALLLVGAEALEFRIDGTHPREQSGDRVPHRQEPGAAVEQARVGFRSEQHLRIVLARDLDAPGKQFREYRGRDQLPRHPRATASAALDTALDDEFVFVGDEAERLQPRLEFWQVAGAKDRLDQRLVTAFADHQRRRAQSRQQRQGAEYDRLAGPGLAGEHVQARAELDLLALDDREILDPQGFDQRSPQRNLLRITSKRFRSAGTSICSGRSEAHTLTRSPSISSQPT